MKKAQILSVFLKILSEENGDKLCKRIIKGYMDKYAELDIHGLENIKNVDRPIIFTCNHLSNSDGLILDRVLRDFDPTFVAGVKLSGDSVTNIGMRVMKTINIKPNSADKDAITKVIKSLRGGENIVIFPEGTRSRVGSMIEAKKGIVLIARMSKATIIPIGMSGSENLLPINKEGSMKSENFHHAKVKVNIGAPIDIPEKEKDEDRHIYDDRVLAHIMKSIAILLPEEYRGVYK